MCLARDLIGALQIPFTVIGLACLKLEKFITEARATYICSAT